MGGKRRQQRHRSQISGSQPVGWELLAVSSDPFTVATLDRWKTQICSWVFIEAANYSYEAARKNFYGGGHRNVRNCIDGLQHRKG